VRQAWLTEGPAGQVEQLQPVAEEDIILRHATSLSRLPWQPERLAAETSELRG
jgi:hypothetical protein